jgi:hypothetical protein
VGVCGGWKELGGHMVCGEERAMDSGRGSMGMVKLMSSLALDHLERV